MSEVRDINGVVHPPGTVLSSRTGLPKRRKASRACGNCQRTHLTCEDSRPCERCVARGLAASCSDGTRKKAKYLRDVPDTLAGTKDTPRKSSSAAVHSAPVSSPVSSSSIRRQSRLSTSERSDIHRGSTSSVSNYSPIPSGSSSTPALSAQRVEIGGSLGGPLANPLGGGYDLGADNSRTGNSIINTNPLVTTVNNHIDLHGSKLNQASHIGQAKSYSTSPLLTHQVVPAVTSTQTPTPADLRKPPRKTTFASTALNSEYRVLSDILTASSNNPHADLSTNSPVNSEDSTFTEFSSADLSSAYLASINQFALGSSDENLLDLLNAIGEPAANEDAQAQRTFIRGPVGPDWLQDDSSTKRPLSLTITSSEAEWDLPSGHMSAGGRRSNLYQAPAYRTTALSEFPQLMEPEDIYTNVKRPYSYTPGYHALITYLRSRFSKHHLMKMARCMANYRPSFIACTNNLKEDDLIFMEKCFQRTLLEYDKFIACSGTPTIVWRRTGQIASVGKEFCVLTGWPRERLLGRQTFIVELMDDNSVLEYFEMFSSMAFGDSRGAMMSECTLLTPSGQKLRTTSTWTLQRDVFGIPMMIIGNFLPILH